MSAMLERHDGHPFAPVVDANARILILGSFPSVRSRAEGFYYGHPQNRFWKVLASVLEVPVPQTVPEKKRMLAAGGIALYDAAQAVTIRGSADASLRDIVPSDLSPIFETATIRAVFANGGRAHAICRKAGIDAVSLPSTSAANARMRLPDLIEVWGQEIRPFLRDDPNCDED